MFRGVSDSKQYVQEHVQELSLKKQINLLDINHVILSVKKLHAKSHKDLS